MAVNVKMMIIFLLLPLWTQCGAVSVEIPNGEPLSLHCSTNPKMWNFFRKANSPTAIVVYLPAGTYGCAGLLSGPGSNGCRNGVTINAANGREIVISSMHYNYTGTYSCEKDDTHESTDVVVVQDDGPTLKYSLENGDTSTQPAKHEVSPGDSLTFSCAIQFGGLKSPGMELIHRGHTGPTENVLAKSSSSSVAFSVNQQASLTAVYAVARSDKTFTIICRLPSLNMSSMTKTLYFNAIYGPLLLDSQNQPITLSDGSAVLNCAVDSYPTATFAWSRVQDGITTAITESGDTYKATEPGEYKCGATNPRTMATASKEFTVTGATGTMPPTGDVKFSDETLATIIGAVVGVVVLIVIIAIVAIYFVRRHREEDDDESKDTDIDSHDKPDVVQAEEPEEHY